MQDTASVTIYHLSQLPPEVDGQWYWWKQADGIKPQLIRRLDDRRYVSVMPLIYTQAIIWGYVGDLDCYEDRWCYHTAEAAILAASAWDGTGEPEGWHRHPRTGRRRPDGDPTKEHIAP